MKCDCLKEVNRRLAEVGARIAQRVVQSPEGVVSLTSPMLLVERVGGGRSPIPAVDCAFCPFCGAELPER